MTLDELRAAADAGTVDTVLLAMTDMQGRLQGKRMTAGHFLDEVVADEARDDPLPSGPGPRFESVLAAAPGHSGVTYAAERPPSTRNVEAVT
jgi:hypothetical protein